MKEDTSELPEHTPSVREIIGRVGTLEYTKRGLIVVFFWLLWGDFCFTIMESVFPSVTPLTLRNLHAPNFVIGLVMTTIPGLLNFVICPWVSFKSDRHRGRWGRRIPFLLFPTPWLSFFLVLIAFAPDIGHFLGRTIFAGSGIQASAIVLFLMGCFVAGFQYFNMFVGSVYYYLFNDVVPEQFLSTFMAFFRVVGTIAGAAFQFFVFRYAETHTKWIFVGAAILYAVAFVLMSLKVKEGEYPPPPENVDGRVSITSSIKTYFVECFAHKFYWYFFIGTAAWELTACIAPWLLFMQQKSLGLHLGQIGFINGLSAGIGAVILIPAGMISDRKHPLRTMLVAMVGLVMLTPVRFIYLLHNFTPAQAYRIEFALVMVILPLGVLYGASCLPMYMRLLPGERFGQYCAAQAMVRSLGVILGGMLAGGFMDLMQALSRGRHFEFYYYRYAPAWVWVCQIIALVFMILVYKHWKLHGGDRNYKAPAVGRVAQSERETATPAA